MCVLLSRQSKAKCLYLESWALLRQKIEHHWRHCKDEIQMSKMNSSSNNGEFEFEHPPLTTEVRKIEFLVIFYYHFLF